MKKRIINVISYLLPRLFTKIAYSKLTNPQIRKLRENEFEIISQSITTDFKFKDFTIKTYEWGDKGETVLLVHGWEGQAGNFSDLIRKLVASGYKVKAFDGPSHGFSSKGRTSLLEFSELIGVLIKKYKVKKIVSHSFGGVATTFALQNNLDIQIDKYVLLTTPDKFLDRINDVIRQNGISNKVKNKLIEKFETETNYKVATLNVSDFVKEIKVAQSLIIHDRNDKVISIEQSKNVYKNWPNSQFIEIEGTGHFRILRTENVLKEVLNYLN